MYIIYIQYIFVYFEPVYIEESRLKGTLIFPQKVTKSLKRFGDRNIQQCLHLVTVLVNKELK